jgi:hypothetical protein
MPDTTISIDRDQRDGLYELVRNHLGSIEDFWIALERTKEFAKAEQLGLEFAEDFRLLRDIGWDEHDERETFDLTMPTHDLIELLKRLPHRGPSLLGSDCVFPELSKSGARGLRAGVEAVSKCLRCERAVSGPAKNPPRSVTVWADSGTLQG